MKLSEIRRKFAQQGKLIDLLNITPKSNWTEVDEYCDTLLHHACRDSRNFDAFLVLIKSGLFDLNTFGQGNWTSLGICISHFLLKNVQVLCMLGCTKVLGFTKVTRYTRSVFYYLNHDASVPIAKFLISIGW